MGLIANRKFTINVKMVSDLMANLMRERERERERERKREREREEEEERGKYTSNDVGIDNGDVMGLEEIGDSALSRSDSTS
jgi:hypothetical protein